MRQCRFCLETGESAADPLLTPCECKGSVEFVHRNCLRRWASLEPSTNGRICTLCRSPFRIEVLPRLEVATGPGYEHFILTHFTIASIGYHYLVLALYSTSTNSSIAEAFYSSCLFAQLISHAVYGGMVYHLWSVVNRQMYWELFKDSQIPQVAAFHTILLVMCIATKNGLYGSCIHILWNIYWREHLQLLREVNQRLIAD